MSFIRDNKLVASSVVQEEVAEATFADAEVVIKNAKLGDTLTEFEIDVSILFDGTAPKASIGIDTDHEKYLTESQCYLLATGTYVIENTVVLASDETIKVYITPDGSTQGALTGTVRFLDT